MIKNDPLEPLSFPHVSHDWLFGGKTSGFEGLIACNESHWLSTLSNQNQSDFFRKTDFVVYQSGNYLVRLLK